MAQAAAPFMAGPPPAPVPHNRLRLLLVPAVVLVLLAIPSVAFAYAQGQVSQGQKLESSQDFQGALAAYSSADAIAGSAVARPLLGQVAQTAENGIARTHLEWGQSDQRAGQFLPAQGQFMAAVASGISDWEVAGNQALAGLYLSWGQSLAGQQKFQDAINDYQLVGQYDPEGQLRSSTDSALAAAYAGYAAWFTTQTPPDYATAVTWYQKLLSDYPDSAQAAQARVDALPHALYGAGLQYVAKALYDQARAAMSQCISGFPKTAWAARANAAMRAKVRLSGTLELGDGTPIPHRLLRIVTGWKIVKAYTYEDFGTIYTVTTDANGNFSLLVPPGHNYLVTWWDPSRQNFVTTFVSQSVPVNQITVSPLEPEHASVATS